MPYSRYIYPTRETADFRYTVRQHDWSGGYNRLFFEMPLTQTEPRYWDGFNIESGFPGNIQLAPLFERVQTDATDKQPLLAAFNTFLYRLEGVTTPAVQKSSDGVTWTTVSMTGGPTNGIRAFAVWRNQLVVATGADNSVFALSAGDVWSTIPTGAPASATANADAVGLSPDGKLLVWQNAVGLRSWDGVQWVVVWPASSGLPSEATCDFIDSSTGTTLIATSDATGSSLHEYFTPEGAAIYASVVTWLNEPNLWFYVSRMYSNAAYIGAKKGIGAGKAANGNGILYRKERGQKPLAVQEIGDGIRGAPPSRDFAIRGLVSQGQQTLWVGSPQRAPNINGLVGIPGVYRYEIDPNGYENISPNSAVDTAPGNVQGYVYSAAIINGEVVITTSTGTWKRSHLTKAAIGYLDSCIYNLHAPDHLKTWRFSQTLIEQATTTETVAFYYRIGTLNGAWLGGTQVQSSGARKIAFPDDNAKLKQYLLNARQIQVRLQLARGADATKQPIITSVAVDASMLQPVGHLNGT